MNNYQRANMALDIVLGAAGRAIWLSARVDGTPLRKIAEEHGMPVAKVREILTTADYALAELDLAGEPEPPCTYKTAWAGFNLED